MGKVILVDFYTKEPLDGIPVYFSPKIRWREDWFMIFQKNLGEIAQDREMKGETFRVWLYMMSKLAFENWILLHNTEIAEGLGMTRQNVGRALKIILDKRLVLRTKVGAASCYRLNSSVGWKGKIKHLSSRRYEELE